MVGNRRRANPAGRASSAWRAPCNREMGFFVSGRAGTISPRLETPGRRLEHRRVSDGGSRQADSTVRRCSGRRGVHGFLGASRGQRGHRILHPDARAASPVLLPSVSVPNPRWSSGLLRSASGLHGSGPSLRAADAGVRAAEPDVCSAVDDVRSTTHRVRPVDIHRATSGYVRTTGPESAGGVRDPITAAATAACFDPIVRSDLSRSSRDGPNAPQPDAEQSACSGAVLKRSFGGRPPPSPSHGRLNAMARFREAGERFFLESRKIL